MKLIEKYTKEVIPKLKEKLGKDNIYSLPKLEKVVVNVGLGPFLKEKDKIEEIEKNITAICGQKPVYTRARKSISGFKLREGMIVGMKVTLRGKRMYDFVDKLINISLPRVRDFRGLHERSVDQMGNLTIGFKEVMAFPEIRADKVNVINGLEVIVKTTAKNREEGLEFLKMLGFPFRSKEK